VKLVCGLGNPGARYAGTRHNAGFRVVEAFAAGSSPAWTSRWDARVATFVWKDEPVTIIEPQTFMNLSGTAVVRAMQQLRVRLDDLLVVHDEVDLSTGRVLVRMGGSENGHRGVGSIIDHLGTRDFARLRIGVGRPEPGSEIEMVDWVLEPFPEGETETFLAAVRKAADGIGDWITGGVPRVQNRLNRRERPAKPTTPSCPGPQDPGPQDRKEVS